MARTLSTALMESVFHAHRWHVVRERRVGTADVATRLVRAIGVVRPLELADLTADGVMSAYFGLNLEQIVSRRYVHTQRTAQVVHGLVDAANSLRFDGILYPSRNNYPQTCVALFERAADKIRVVDDLELAEHRDWPAFLREYDVTIRPTR